MSRLTTLQKKGMGKYVSDFSQEFFNLYEKPNSDNIEEENELQPISEFEEMGSRKPNAAGTGRNLITKNRKKLYLMKLGKKFKVDFKALSEIMNAFFGMEIEMLDCGLKVEVIDKVNSVIDSKKGLIFPLKNQKNSRIDVFSLFDVLVEYVPKDCYSLITITDRKIYDPEVPENLIYGRACGDRVAVIHDLDLMKTTMNTTIHETLHTMGIDHCIAWTCLMNAFIVDTFDICPMDLKKLEISQKFDLREREEKLLRIFKKLKFSNEIKITQRKLNIIKKMKKN